MAITKNSTQWFGLSTDTKPTAALTGQLGSPLTGDSFRETDTGKSYLWIGSVWVGASASFTDGYGTVLNFVPTLSGGQVPVTPAPDVIFQDNFNGTVIDVVNRWQAPVLAAGGTMTQAGGSLVTTLGTTASAASSITSIENFEPSINNLTLGGLMTIDAASVAAKVTNTSRCVGYYTKPGSFTAATPVQDGYVWEYDITGTLGASIYSGGVRIFNQAVNFNSLLGNVLPLFVAYQGLNAQFYYGDFTKPLITVPFLQASTLNLPFGFHSINHTAGPASAPTWNMADCAIIDSSGVQQTLWNGQTYSRTRSPTKFVNLNAVSIAAEATIWTPTSGRRFRLMGYVLESGTIGGNVLLKDNTAGSTIMVVPFGAANGVIVAPPMGNGILSAAVNNVLTATGTATQTLSGYVFGTEE